MSFFDKLREAFAETSRQVVEHSQEIADLNAEELELVAGGESPGSGNTFF